jgi:hypothetical protein
MKFAELKAIVNSELTVDQPISVGADIEAFLLGEDTGNVFPAAEAIGGSKDDPMDLGDATLHPDNVMVEFGFKPGLSAEEFQTNLAVARKAVSSLVEFQSPANLSLEEHRMNNIGIGHYERLLLEFVSMVNIDRQFMFLTKAKGFVEVGCDPFLTVYEKEAIKYDVCTLGSYRFAGGHIHIGYDHITEVTAEMNEAIIRNMDFIYLGFIEPLILDDEAPERMETYGTPGAYRHKPYGVEYRTPSNVWVDRVPATVMYDVASLSARMALEGISIPSAISKNTRSLREGELDAFVKKHIVELEKVKIENGKTQ